MAERVVRSKLVLDDVKARLASAQVNQIAVWDVVEAALGPDLLLCLYVNAVWAEQFRLDFDDGSFQIGLSSYSTRR
jgi:hypothetical protein